jgi:cobalt-zinc-cadmium efflux system outer membrane protein
VKKLLFLLFLLFLQCAAYSAYAAANEATPNLPPRDVVERVLLNHPDVLAASSQVSAEEANRTRLVAGQYEWNVRMGGQQRRVNGGTGADERFGEWNASLERPLRMPGKSALDAEIGASGVSLAEAMRSDALHEASRNLLKAWFSWLKESATAQQWTAQAALLERQAKVVLRRQQLGDAARLDAVQAEAALAQAEAQLAQAQVRYRTATEELRRRFPGLPIVEPSPIAEPLPVGGSELEWVERIMENSHELAIARGEIQRAQSIAGRMRSEKVPDPSVGVQFMRERGGQENIVGAYISIPLPGEARRAGADVAAAQMDASMRRELGVRQKINAEAASLYYSADARFAIWQSARHASARLSSSAEMMARAYQLGEGTLSDLLLARRQANEAQLALRLAQMDALELRYRLLLDAHQLWNLD